MTFAIASRLFFLGLFLFAAEQLNGRVAMMGVMGTTAFELLAGHPVVQMVGLR